MPRVATIEDVFAVARYKADQKKASTRQANALGVPSLPGLGFANPGIVLATVQWEFVGGDFVEEPNQYWALVEDAKIIEDANRKHREANMDPGRAGLPPLSTFSNVTPYLIVKTVE